MSTSRPPLGLVARRIARAAAARARAIVGPADALAVGGPGERTTVRTWSPAPFEQLVWAVSAGEGRATVVDARHRLDDFLSTRRVERPLIDSAHLVFEEMLVASLARGADAAEVSVALDGGAIRLAVSTNLPEPTATDSDHHHHDGAAWGMVLIDQLATRWGIRPRLDRKPGSTMWAEVVLA